MKLASAIAVFLAIPVVTVGAQVNGSDKPIDPNPPFSLEKVAELDVPWRIAFLSDGRMLITLKTGGLEIVSTKGEQIKVGNVPAVKFDFQGGMLGVYLSPSYASDHGIYLTYSEPNEQNESSLALAHARLDIQGGSASLQDLKVIWRDGARGAGGQFGGAVAFSPDKQFLFLSVGERQRMTPAQDPNSPLGKILRLTLDGKPAPGNPQAGKTGAQSIPIIRPPRNTELAKTAEPVATYTFPGPNLTPSETWSSGHRTPYGLTFGPDGRLWELEHGPRGGDELNLIEPGKNYGWPLVSYANNYDGVPIPSPDTRSDLARPSIYWTPVIAPGNMAFYSGNVFPQWKGDLLISGMASQSLSLITFDGSGNPVPSARWSVGHRIRDVAVAPDGNVWLIEDSKNGGLFKLVPKK